MSFRTVPYDKLKRRIEAMLGSKIDTDDEDLLQPLVDGAVHYAYQEINYWPRYLNVQPRTLQNGYVDFSEDSVVVSSAGVSETNGLYTRAGSLNGYPVYTLNHSEGSWGESQGEYTIYYDIVNSYWVLNEGPLPSVPSGFSYETVYYVDSNSETVPRTGWVAGSNYEDSNPPYVDATKEIGQVLKVWNAEILTKSGACPLDFYSDANGIRVPRGSGSVVWVAYKEEMTEEWGDGLEGTSSEIPAEFADYAAYDSAYQLQFNQRQSNPNQYPFAYRKVTDVLDQQKLKVTAETGYRIISDRFKTMYGVDVSFRT